MKHKKIAYPLSETQEKEVWEKEDKMDPSQFTLQKYFKLHDVDASGKWNKQEVKSSHLRIQGFIVSLKSNSTRLLFQNSGKYNQTSPGVEIKSFCH